MADEYRFHGAVLRRDDASVVLDQGDGVELTIPADGIVRIQDLTGPHGQQYASIDVRGDAVLRAAFRADAAQLEPSAPGRLPLVAYERGGAGEVSILPGELAREWMDASTNRFAYRCLPLLIANQSGWVILNTFAFRATWTGEVGVGGIKLEFIDDVPGRTRYAASHFGHGLLTFSVPYLFRTPEGFNLHVRGPVNMPKDGIAALDGIVETDWSDSTFTMNWKFTRTHHTVTFAEDEPIAMISPIRRHEVERFRPVFRPMETDPDTEAGFMAFNESRAAFNARMAARDPEVVRQGWQRHYMRGETSAGKRAREHQTGVSLDRFIEE
jgi:hypothetical protein